MNHAIQRGLSVVAVILIPAVLAVALFATISMFAGHQSRQTRLAWGETFGSWDEIMLRYPATKANSLALELEQRAAAIGVSLAPRYLSERAQPMTEASEAFMQVKMEVWDSLFEQFQHLQRGAVDPPPAILVEYLDDYGQQLDDLRRLLIEGEAPVWESDLSWSFSAPIPNLLGQIDLHKLLISIALLRIHSGDTQGALEEVEASFNLARSLRDSPILINQLIYIASTRMQVGALRHIRDLPDIWIDRLSEHDLRQSFVTALKYEGWVWLYHDEKATGGSAWHFLRTTLARPYTRLCLADVSDAWRECVANLEQVETLCDHDLAAENADLNNISVPRWNKLGPLLVPNMANALHRLARLELDLELIQLAAEADASRRTNGSWPDAGTRSSRVCPEDGWTYRSSPEGLEIAITREIQWPGQVGNILPQEILLTRN